MAAYNKFQDFVQQLCTAKHNFTAAGDVCRAYLTDATPNAATHAVKADIAEIGSGNGYPSPATDMQNDMTEAAGTATTTAIDIVYTASGGSIGPFRYVVTYNDTQTSPADPLINWWDYGSELTLLTGESFTIDFGASWFTVA